MADYRPTHTRSRRSHLWPWITGALALIAGAAMLYGYTNGWCLFLQPDTAEEWYRTKAREQLLKDGLYPVFSGREYNIGDAINLSTRLADFAGTACFHDLPINITPHGSLLPIQFTGQANIGIAALGLALGGKAPVSVNISYEDVEVHTVRATRDFVNGVDKVACADFPRPIGMGAGEGRLIVGQVWRAAQVVDVTVSAGVRLDAGLLTAAAGAKGHPPHLEQSGVSTLRVRFPKQVVAVAPAFVPETTTQITLGLPNAPPGKPPEVEAVDWIWYFPENVPLRTNAVEWLIGR
ncbi:hypothetical protein [Azospirillum argentinense]